MFEFEFMKLSPYSPFLECVDWPFSVTLLGDFAEDSSLCTELVSRIAITYDPGLIHTPFAWSLFQKSAYAAQGRWIPYPPGSCLKVFCFLKKWV